MKFIKSNDLKNMNDNELIYVNRNAINHAIVEYEIIADESKCEELDFLLKLWCETHNLEKKNGRVEPFIKMKSNEAKKCFRNYQDLPLGTFGYVKN